MRGGGYRAEGTRKFTVLVGEVAVRSAFLILRKTHIYAVLCRRGRFDSKMNRHNSTESNFNSKISIPITYIWF